MNCNNFATGATNSSGRCSLSFSGCASTNLIDTCVNRFVTYFNANISSQFSLLGNCTTQCPDFPPAYPPSYPPNPYCPDLAKFYQYPVYVSSRQVRKIWDNWDLPVLALYILLTQLYLHAFGRHRRKSTTRGSVIDLNVSVPYLLADFVATIALGKLSNVKKDVAGHVEPRSLVRGIWAPIILFYLGGPDTITVLALEENQMWLRHLVGLLIQGLRTSYVLYVTWAKHTWLSALALGMLIPGLIKYSERVWVIRSRVRGMTQGFGQLDDSTIVNLDQDKKNTTTTSGCCSPNEPVIEAYSCFQNLKPHVPRYGCDRTRLDNLVEKFQKWARSTSSGDGSNVNVFKLIEIELGFMYDVLFSKLGVIFTQWGCILRLISLSCIVCVLVGFFSHEKRDLSQPDHLITVFLLLGALLLEIGGVLVQLGSDWAVVWAFKLPTALSMVSTPILCLHKFVVCKSRNRWAGLMGQFSLLDYCNKYEPTMCSEIMSSICGGERTLMNFSLPSSPVTDDVKKLIIDQLCGRLLQNVDGKEVRILRTFSAMTRGETALQECGALPALQWSVEFEFAENLIIWHIATEVCYHSDSDSEGAKPEVMKPTRILSNYMMHLLLICASTFPICNMNVDLSEVRTDMKEIFLKGKGTVIIWSSAKACELLLDEKNSSSNATVSSARKLARNLKANNDRWTIMSKVWVDMLCYAASRCSMKHHAQELRHGGEFITHIWLLLQHFGVRRSLDENRSAGGGSGVLKDALRGVDPSNVDECFYY